MTAVLLAALLFLFGPGAANRPAEREPEQLVVPVRSYDVVNVASDRLGEWVPHLVASRELSYGPHPKQHISFYPPTSGRPMTGAIVNIHGGGWELGDDDLGIYTDRLNRLLSHNGYGVYSIDYRDTRHGATLPVIHADIAAALERIQRDLPAGMPYGLTGPSSGATLVTEVLLSAGQDAPFERVTPAYGVAFSPTLENTPRAWRFPHVKEHAFPALCPSAPSSYAGCTAADLAYVNPLTRADPGDVDKPIYVAFGATDATLFPDVQIAAVAEARSRGATIVFDLVPDAGFYRPFMTFAETEQDPSGHTSVLGARASAMLDFIAHATAHANAQASATHTSPTHTSPTHAGATG